MKAVKDSSSGAEIEICDHCFEKDRVSHQPRFSEILGRDAHQSECAAGRCLNFRDAKPMDLDYRPHLFSLTEAASEVKVAEGAADTAIATGKLLGKTIANVGVLAGKLGVLTIRNMPRIAKEMLEQQEKNAVKAIQAHERKGEHELASKQRQHLEKIRELRSRNSNGEVR
ncbi:hypothetical protein [Xanthomonas sacchari]|uniref:hypothetical protein n=1 Tax=Xanthomonas sacchari TaxID=56458 RepID=UPI00225E55EF|nr:hypothetical protein [Xanthomonas sacchari]